MSPAVKPGDLVIYYRLESKVVPKDLVIFEHEKNKQIHRVVAVEGDTVDITEEGLVINGALQQEAHIHTKTEPYREGIKFPITVGEGEVFLLSDNREGGVDSRIYGTVPIKALSGEVITIIRRRDF